MAFDWFLFVPKDVTTGSDTLRTTGGRPCWGGGEGRWSLNFDWLVRRSKPEFLLGDPDQSLGFVCGNGWSNGLIVVVLLGWYAMPSAKDFPKFNWNSYSAGQMPQLYQESRAETRNRRHARINRTDQSEQPINQSIVVTHSKDKWIL